MYGTFIEKAKREIESRLKAFLQEKDIELFVASNDNIDSSNPLVRLEALDDVILSGSKLLFEIKVVLGLLGKSWQCEELVKGIYYALHPHNISLSDLTVLLMSIHVEEMASLEPEYEQKRAIMRYILECLT
ncbi:MAG TPA: hypothetical protein VFT64_03570 [Rickettsiales bacterium]|nr:hypothetical protein [Rickettsiales bacterium]